MKAFQTFLAKYELSPQSGTWILGVSGGVDSVVLAHLIHKQGIPLLLLHANFQLRGEESMADEQFVRQLAADWKLPLEVAHFDTNHYATQHKCSIQVAARALRYAWFHQVRQKFLEQGKAAFIATAHHGNDTVETVLLNLMRGTGIEGLHGILPVREHLLRPLLGATKKELLDYANSYQLKWVEDASNMESYYTRNAIRHKIIPVAEALFAAAVTNIMATAEKMQEVEMLVEQAMAIHKKRLLKQVNDEWHIPILLLQKSAPLTTIIWYLLKPFGFTEGQVQEVIKLLDASSGAYVQAPNWRIIRHGKWLLIAPLQTVQASHILIEGDHGEAAMNKGVFRWKNGVHIAPEKLKQLAINEAVVDAKNLSFPLLLRPWKAGDYFYPLGMRKKKKIARLLIDLKLSKTAKEQVWVMESMHKIVWVVGLRIDDRFKVMPSTEQVLHLEFIAR